MKVQIKNLQKTKKIDLTRIQKNINRIFELLSLSPESISFVFCDNECIKRLNKRYLGKSSPTDVIAFSLRADGEGEFLGEVVISIDETIKNSKKFKTTFFGELILYMIHGVLHLLGYDDKNESCRCRMRKKEQELMKELTLDGHKR